MLHRLCRTRFLPGTGVRVNATVLSIHPLKVKQNASRGFTSTSRLKNSRRFGSQDFEALKPRNWDPRIQLSALALAGGTVYYVYHLEQVPITGRWRFIDVSPQEEQQIAVQTHQQLLNEYGSQLLESSHPVALHVRQVVDRLLEASELGRLKDDSVIRTPGDTWYDEPAQGEMHVAGELRTPLQREWNLLVVHDDNMINAMASNGTIVVFTGILPICKDPDGLAAVIGHEIAHVVARHTAERLSSMTVFSSIAFLIDFLLQSSFNIGSIITTLALQLPNSRKQELEADRIGLTITAKACFDPHGAPEVQQRMAMLEKLFSRRVNVGFLNTHPLSHERARILESLLPDAYAARAASSYCTGIEENFKAFRDALSSEFEA